MVLAWRIFTGIVKAIVIWSAVAVLWVVVRVVRVVVKVKPLIDRVIGAAGVVTWVGLILVGLVILQPWFSLLVFFVGLSLLKGEAIVKWLQEDEPQHKAWIPPQLPLPEAPRPNPQSQAESKSTKPEPKPKPKPEQVEQAVQALRSLGFKASTARQAVEAVYQPGEEVSTEELIKRALRGPEDR